MSAQTSKVTSTGTFLVSGTFDEFTGAPVVDSTLKLWIDSGQTSSYPGSGSTAYDLSGNGNNFTIAGSPAYSDTQGWRINTGQTTRYMICNPITMPTTTISFEIWVKIDTGRTDVGLVSYASSANANDFLIGGGAVNLAFYRGASFLDLTTWTNVADGTWKQIVRTSNRTTGEEILYINGVRINSGTLSAGTLITSGGSLVLGQDQDSIGGGFSGGQSLGGSISIFRMYNAILTPAQVAQNYNANCKRFGLSPVTETQMPVVKRETSSGTILLNGSFDEVTYNIVTPAIKNLVQYTEQLDNAYWVLTNGLLPVTANATIAPNGTLTADKITENTATSTNHYFQSTSLLISSSTQYTWSIYAKAGERTFIDLALGTASFWVNSARSATFNLTTGAVVSTQGAPLVASITSAGGGWYRCSITATSSSTSGMSSNGQVRLCNASASNTYNGDGVSGAYFWGAQLEQNLTTTMYQGIGATNTLAVPGFVKRETSDGSLYVTDKFDEVTGMVITNGLILQFDPGKVESFISNGTRLVDISGNTRNATLLGSVTYDSTSSSLLFDSPAITVDNRIALTAGGVDNTISFTDGSEYTIECWCKIASDAAVTYHSIAGRGTTNPWLGILKNASSYNLFFRELGATYFYSTTINVSVFTGWTQVVFSVSASRVVSYYVNHAAGTFTDTDTVTNTLFTINRLAAGYTSSGNYYAFDGNIGPINIYNRALSAAEVTNNFEALRNRFGI